MPRRIIAGATVVVVLLAACSTDDEASRPPVRTMPRGLEVCAEVDGDDDPRIVACLDAIEFQLAAGTSLWAGSEPPRSEHVSRAIAAISPYSSTIKASSAFLRDDGDDDSPDSIDPIMTRWTIGVHERVLWTCFEGDSVAVSTAEC